MKPRSRKTLVDGNGFSGESRHGLYISVHGNSWCVVVMGHEEYQSLSRMNFPCSVAEGLSICWRGMLLATCIFSPTLAHREEPKKAHARLQPAEATSSVQSVLRKLLGRPSCSMVRMCDSKSPASQAQLA